MSKLESKLKNSQQKYEKILIRKLQPYRCWQSYNYFSEHYCDIFNQVSKMYIEFILCYKGFIFSDWDLEQMSNYYFEGIVVQCEMLMKNDFERQVIIENSYIEIIL